jgi:hypothetical protein
MSVQLNLIPPVQASQEEDLAIVTPTEQSEVVRLAVITVSTDISSTRRIEKKIKCDFEGCRKRISTIEASHRFFRDHECTFDYQKRERERLAHELLGKPSKKSVEAFKPSDNETY